MFQRILLALDAGDSGAVAVSFTVALAKQCGASVHVAHVDDSLLGVPVVSCEQGAYEQGAYEQGAYEQGAYEQGASAALVARALTEMRECGVAATGVTYRTASFDVAGAICEVAEQVRADVIVLGSRRRRFPTPFRRRTRDRVARRTCLPLLTAPPPLQLRTRERVRAGVQLLDSSLQL